MLSIILMERLDNRVPSLDSNVIRLNRANKYDSLDYLFIGPSYNYCLIKPSMFDSINVKSYNIGIATAGVNYYEQILKNYLAHPKAKPKNIALSFSLITFSDIASDNWDNYPIHRYLQAPLTNEEICFKYGAYSRYWNMMTKSLRKSVLGVWENNKIPQTNEYNSLIGQSDSLKGYDKEPINYFTDSLYQADKIKYEPFLQSIFSVSRKEKLIGIVKSLKKNGIHVVLLEAPTFKLKDFFDDQYKIAYVNFKRELSAENINVIFVENMDNKNYYSNIDHCNENGANEYTKQLIKSLRL
jgi:hypothetical protein